MPRARRPRERPVAIPRRPSSARLLRSLALPAIGLILLSGCGRKSAPAASFLATAAPGHAYVAQLLVEHPLYPQLQRLEQELAALRQPGAVPATAPLFLELGELFLPGPEPPRFPLAQFAEHRRQWELALLPDRPAQPSELAADLKAELQWQQRLAHRWAEQELVDATAREDAAVAEARAQAVRDRQEALNNAGLDLNLADREAQAAAQSERQRLWQQIDIEEAQARSLAEEHIAAEQERINAELQRRLAAAETQAERRMRKRTANPVNSGSGMATRMSNMMTPPEPPARLERYSWRPTALPSAGDFQPNYGPLLARDQQLRAAQAVRLAAARAELAASLYEATAVATKRIGMMHRWQVLLPPDEPATGRDLTEQIRPELRALFHPNSP